LTQTDATDVIVERAAFFSLIGRREFPLPHVVGTNIARLLESTVDTEYIIYILSVWCMTIYIY
jgi:hypothetical protein